MDCLKYLDYPIVWMSNARHERCLYSIWHELFLGIAKAPENFHGLLFGGGINLVFPHVMRLALTEESSLYIVTNSATLGLVLGCLFVVQGICFYFRTLLFGELGHGVAHNLRVDLYRSLVAKPISFFDRTHPGDVVSCLVADAQMLQNAISVRVSVMFRYGLQVLGGVALMLWLSPLLTLLILLILPVLVGISLLLAKRLKLLRRDFG